MERRRRNSYGGDYDSAFTFDKGHIEHPISRFDTLAGIAIKYGVEVADIKKMNGLATDLQMFARKTVQIPLPGKHPPSPCLTNGSETSGQNNSEQIPPHHVQCDLINSFPSLRLTWSSQQKVSPAMNSLQGFYGLQPTATSEALEAAVFRKGETKYLEDSPFLRPSPAFNLPLGLGQKSRSLANGLVSYNGELVDNILLPYFGESDSDKWNENSNRPTPEMVLKEPNSIVSGFSARIGKGLALRPKAAASRTTFPADAKGGGGLNPIPVDSQLADRLSGVVRKSSSMSSLHANGGSSSSSSSIRATSKRRLKPDLQAGVTKPMFDGLPLLLPTTGRRNKAALD